MSESNTPPPSEVARAFGLAGTPVALTGGQRTVWRVGAGVLKRLDAEVDTLDWLEGLLRSLDGRDDFRVAPPLRSVTGDLVVAGWTAWRWEPGRTTTQRWLDIITVGNDFHSAVNGVPRPDFLDRRTDRWAVADRVAWGELPPPDGAHRRSVATLAAALRPLDGAPQLIHGDLAGNVLFTEGLPALVIDVSPYWRPPSMATAVVVADALLFGGADVDLLDRLAGVPDFDQYLLRALIFRVVADGLEGPGHPAAGDRFAPVIEAVLRSLTA